MSVVYRNKYRNYDTCGLNESAVDAQRWADLSWHSFERVEMHINGHWHRPPVGISAKQASHEWYCRTRWDAFGNPVQDFFLVPQT